MYLGLPIISYSLGGFVYVEGSHKQYVESIQLNEILPEARKEKSERFDAPQNYYHPRIVGAMPCVTGQPRTDLAYDVC